jgi:hypothetical protein
MILLDALSISIAAFALYQVNELRKQTNDRITRLEARQPGKQEAKAAPVQAKQVFEKPVVPGAKETTSLQIGGGKLHADQENHVYEWA